MKKLAIAKKCQWCGQQFIPPQNLRATEQAKRFCSLECAAVATVCALDWVKKNEAQG